MQNTFQKKIRQPLTVTNRFRATLILWLDSHTPDDGEDIEKFGGNRKDGVDDGRRRKQGFRETFFGNRFRMLWTINLGLF